MDSYGQWNTVARQDESFFIGGYGGGFLLEWHPSDPWVPTEKNNAHCNPVFLTECTPVIHRPHDLLVHPDGKRIVLAGTPGYGYTGGGLLFWDRETKTNILVEHAHIIPEHATMSLVALPDNKLLGGTTTSPGTGGEKKATIAELYVMDMDTKQVEWHEAVLPGIQEFTDMCKAANGLVYGIADRTHFFVFDPNQRGNNPRRRHWRSWALPAITRDRGYSCRDPGIRCTSFLSKVLLPQISVLTHSVCRLNLPCRSCPGVIFLRDAFISASALTCTVIRFQSRSKPRDAKYGCPFPGLSTVKIRHLEPW